MAVKMWVASIFKCLNEIQKPVAVLSGQTCHLNNTITNSSLTDLYILKDKNTTIHLQVRPLLLRNTSFLPLWLICDNPGK